MQRRAAARATVLAVRAHKKQRQHGHNTLILRTINDVITRKMSGQGGVELLFLGSDSNLHSSLSFCII
jgi:hypothetical protein